jgi:hypothetical protein
MNYVEHLSVVQHVRYLIDRSPQALSGLCFFVDGPLAFFGNAAWMHAQVMRILEEAADELRRRRMPEFTIIGLQKTGQVVEHAAAIDRLLPPGRILPIDDQYRGEFIAQRPEGWEGTFGYETYYGQDFILKTATGRLFIFALPYPFRSKEPVSSFRDDKADLNRYRTLGTAISTITHFELDLYQNAVVPIALAHRHASISLVPGGRVLDLLTASAIQARG